MKNRHYIFLASMVILFWVGILSLPEASDILAGKYEFNQWLGITTSNKTWLWLICVGIIGACTGYLGWTLYKRRMHGRRG